MPDSSLPADLPRDLHYVDDTQPGIRRKKVRGTFQYLNAKGERITDADEIKRLNALAVPPAYTDVWICADPRATCKPPAATPVAASSTVTTHAGAKCATATNMRACRPLARLAQIAQTARSTNRRAGVYPRKGIGNGGDVCWTPR